MRIVSFDPKHCRGVKAHPSQADYQYMLDDPKFLRGVWDETYSALDGDNLIAIGGAAPIGHVLGGWVLFTDKITPARFVAIHRAVVGGLEKISIVAHIDPKNPQAMRWAEMLGMRMTNVQ